MTTSGKPVFVYPDNNNTDDDLDTTRLCGIVQALRVSMQQSLDKREEMHCLQTTQSTKVVFTTIQSFTFMVIIHPHFTNSNIRSTATELPLAFWKAQMERLYLAMIMMLTTQIHDMLEANHQLDVEALWRNKQPEQLCCLEEYSSSRLHKSLLVWGIPTCFLSGESWRRELAAAFLSIQQHESCSTPEPPWMALLLARTNSNDSSHSSSQKLITYAASTFFPGFTTSDGALFWNWLQDQLTFPDDSSSSSSFPICFPHFHAAGYLYASWHSLADPCFTLVLLYPHEETDASPFVKAFDIQTRSSTFWDEYRSSQWQERWLWEEYLDVTQAWHFLFRMHHDSTLFTQCISSPADGDINSNSNQEEMWRTYHQLAWRLRLGSTGVESTLNQVMMMHGDNQLSRPNSSRNPTVASDCPLLQCMDVPPSIQGVTYLTQASTTYLAMSGRDFELYMTTSSSILPEEVAAFGAKLVRRLLQDQSKWFVTKTLTFF